MPRRERQPMYATPPTDGYPDVLAGMDEIIAEADWAGAHVGGPKFPAARHDDPPVICQPFARLTVVLTGVVRHGVSVRGERVVVSGGPGTVFYFATNAWNLPVWDTAASFIGCVFRPDFVRILRFSHPGGRAPKAASRTAHHTRAPLGAAGRQTIAALDALADEGPGEALRGAVGDLMRGLVRIARTHVAADLAGGAQDGALRTWQEAMQYIGERLGEELSRERVASALGLHPNYLSALFTRLGGASFQRTVEGLRVDRAKAALAVEPDLRVAELARRCGYADSGHFIRVFKRRTGRTPGRFARR